MRKYVLGTKKEEQERLHLQRKVYGKLPIKFSSTDTICEIGCGAGANLWIAKHLAHGKFVGIDTEQEQLDSAKSYADKLGLNNTLFIRSVGEKTEFPDNYFDVVFCSFLLIHQPDPMQIIKEMFRITKKGGSIFVFEPDFRDHYFVPDKDIFTKCYLAFGNYTASKGNFSIEIAKNLYPLLRKMNFCKIKINPIVKVYTGESQENILNTLKCYYRLFSSIRDELIKENVLTTEDFNNASIESKIVSDDSYIKLSLIMAQCIK
ncbi:MAG TPA: class I SAM-dependent methyltransferase [Victivallales bacterium]|nr:class I SAM-dependent methyltransferase [Victivallales bacterium]